MVRGREVSVSSLKMGRIFLNGKKEVLYIAEMKERARRRAGRLQFHLTRAPLAAMAGVTSFLSAVKIRYRI